MDFRVLPPHRRLPALRLRTELLLDLLPDVVPQLQVRRSLRPLPPDARLADQHQLVHQPLPPDAEQQAQTHKAVQLPLPDALLSKSTRQLALQTSGPARLNRRYNSTWPPPEVIHDGRQALQSVRAFSDLRDDIFSDMRAEERLRSSSLPTLPRPATADTTAASLLSTAVDLAGESSQNLQEFSNHVPAANIDWTLPSTRRREYEKIDKARSGFRGLMRRVTPRILWKNGRVGFHDDGNGSDAGTIRRFRMDVSDGDIAVDEIANSPWWKFGKMTLKAGKSPTEEGTELRDLERAGEEYAIANHGGPVEDGQQAEARKGNPGGDAVDEGEGSGLTTVTGRAASSPRGAYEEADGHKPTTNNEMPIVNGTNKGDKHKNAAEGRSKSGVKGRKEANMKWNCFSLGRKKLGHA